MLLEPLPSPGDAAEGVTGLRLLQAEDNFPTSQQVLHALCMESWATEGQNQRKTAEVAPCQAPSLPLHALVPTSSYKMSDRKT